MAPRHADETDGNGVLTDRVGDGPAERAAGDGRPTAPLDGGPVGRSRRSVLLVAGTALAATGVGVLSGRAAAVSPGATVDDHVSTDGEVHFEPGEYRWNGSSLDIGSSGAVIGDGNPGDVVWNLEGGTMAGTNQGTIQNIVVRGENQESKAGIDVYAGCTFDGFVWPEGGTQNEDRALYTPSGAGDSGTRSTIRNSAWAQMGNNGAYVDKIPHTFENCAALNNNVAGIRVGHRELSDPLSETTVIRNCLVANVAAVPNDPETGTSNGRGIRLRHDAHLVIEDCWFLFRDVQGASYAIDVEDDAPGSVVEIRNCTFYTETDNPPIVDETGGDADITVESCVVAGPGNHEVDVQGVTGGLSAVDSVSIPTPSALTGVPQADEVPGVEPGVAPWSSEARTSSGGSSTTTPTATASEQTPTGTEQPPTQAESMPEPTAEELSNSVATDNRTE